MAWAFGLSVCLILGAVFTEVLSPKIGGEERAVWFATQIFVGLSFVPLSLYASAALIRLIARAFGGAGGWRETRVALFWSGLITGPAGVLIIALGAAAGAGPAAHSAAGLIWALWLAPMLAEAHGFRKGRVFAAFAAIAAAAWLLPIAAA